MEASHVQVNNEQKVLISYIGYFLTSIQHGLRVSEELKAEFDLHWEKGRSLARTN